MFLTLLYMAILCGPLQFVGSLSTMDSDKPSITRALADKFSYLDLVKKCDDLEEWMESAEQLEQLEEIKKRIEDNFQQ